MPRKLLLSVASIIVFAAAWHARAQLNPPVVTVHTSSQTQYAATFNGTTFDTVGCAIPNVIDGYGAWGAANYIRRGDFNADGILDLASLNGGTIMIKTTAGSGDNCLRSLPAFIVANEWGGAAYTFAGDFNGDGKDDIASANGSSVHMKLSTAGSGFTGFTSETWVVTNAWAEPGWNFVGDFNGDGRDDIASAIGGAVYMKLSKAINGFDSVTWAVANLWGGSSYAKVGDFNGDGRADIASPHAGSVYMKLSTGTGFQSATWSVANTWGAAGYTFAADFNNDGRTDIASADAGTVRMKLSQGTYFASQDWPVTNAWGGASYTWIIDHNSDGYKDIVSVVPGLIYVKKNLGSGFVSQAFSFYGEWAPAEWTWALDRAPFP